MHYSRNFFVSICVMTLFLFQNCSNSFEAQKFLEDSRSLSSLKQEDGTPISFGFYATAYNQDFIDDAKELANIVHIDSSSGDVNFIVSAIQRAKDNNLKAIVSVFFLFYNCTASACPPRSQADAFAKWNQLKVAIQQRDLIGSIFSFYLDEPELQARIRNAEAARIGIYRPVDLIGELEFVARTIKADFPQAKMQMTSSFFDVRDSMTLPQGFDIFGLDCYNGWDSCGIAEYHKSIPEYYAILNSKVEQLERRDGRRRSLVLFPPTFYDESPTAWQYPSKALSLELFDKYVAFAQTNPRITAIIGFLWINHYENGKKLFGANEFPEIREKIRTSFFSPGPPPPDPQIISNGTGCDDNLCLWVTVTTLTPDYEVYVRDPQNFGFAPQITNQDALLVRTREDGIIVLSFRIPPSALAIYNTRGLEVMLVNKLNNQKRYWARYFPRP